MELNRDNIYRLIAGTLGVPRAKFNPNLPLVATYKVDSLSIFDLALVIEEQTGNTVDIPATSLDELSTGKLFADYILERYTDA